MELHLIHYQKQMHLKAEIQYDFNIQNNHDKMLSEHDIHKIIMSDCLKLLIQILTYSILLTEKLKLLSYS